MVDEDLSACRPPRKISYNHAKFTTFISAGMVQATAFESSPEGLRKSAPLLQQLCVFVGSLAALISSWWQSCCNRWTQCNGISGCALLCTKYGFARKLRCDCSSVLILEKVNGCKLLLPLALLIVGCWVTGQRGGKTAQDSRSQTSHICTENW